MIFSHRHFKMRLFNFGRYEGIRHFAQASETIKVYPKSPYAFFICYPLIYNAVDVEHGWQRLLKCCKAHGVN